MRQVVAAQSAEEGGLTRSTGVAESDGAHDRRLSTKFYKRMDKLAREKTALRSRFVEILM